MILSLRGVTWLLAMGLALAPLSIGIAQEDEPTQPPPEPELLTAEQINLIRVWELPTDLSQLRLTIRVPREVMLEVFDKYRESPLVPRGRVEQQAFLREPMERQLKLLFDLAPLNPTVRSYYSEVQINGEPPAMIEFRRRVYGNYVQRYFRRYFGDGRIPELELVTARGNTLGEMYTNFYILSMTSYDGQPMINRYQPADSLLLQWGLPRESAKHPAPGVAGWRPTFRGTDDENFQRMVEALDLLYENPRYGIEFELPGDRRDSQPEPEQAPTAPAAPGA